jgi:glycosyltransferase involved in cell wall biosynthesis
MRILMVTGQSYRPQRVGGSESSTHELAISLLRAGHQVAVLSDLESWGPLFEANRRSSRASGHGFPADTGVGYPVFRGLLETSGFAAGLKEARAAFRPDVVACQSGQPLRWARECAGAGLPVLVYLRDVEFERLGEDPGRVPRASYVANSAFTARRFEQAFGIRSTVIPPLVLRGFYAVERPGSSVLFVNPHPIKGVATALALARMRPQVPFIFQRAWHLSADHLNALRHYTASLPNVELRNPCLDMREAYRSAKILIAPSQWNEAWGRVVTEAQTSGIPAIVSGRGGLPEAVGQGGIVVPLDASDEQWAGALDRLWNNAGEWGRLSQLARASADRPEIQPDVLLRRFEAALQLAIKGDNR